MVNVGEQNKPHSSGGRSILDYSLIVCFTLIILLAILVLDAFEYISVPGAKKATNKFKEMTSAMTSDELLEVQKQIEDAKIELAEKKAEVEKIVTKVEEEVKKEKEEEDKAAGKAVHVETPEEIKEEKIEKEQIVEAVVKQEIQKTWCGGCQFGQMAFTCAKRVAWLMEAYGLNEEMAKEATMSKCGHRRKLRGNYVEVNNWEILIRDMMQISPVLN